MNHIFLVRLVVLKRPGFQSRQYGMPCFNNFDCKLFISKFLSLHFTRLFTDIFIPDTGIHTPRTTLLRTAWVWLKHLRTSVGRFRFCLYKWSMTSFAACVAQKSTSTMLSSNVQSNDLLMDCTGWQFWTMRQSNGCSTLAPRSSAAKQWFNNSLKRWGRALLRQSRLLLLGIDLNFTECQGESCDWVVTIRWIQEAYQASKDE